MSSVLVERLPRPVYQKVAGLKCGEGMTKQAHKGECDINRIVARARKAGGLDVASVDQRGVYGDFSKIGSFVDMQNLLARANQDFARLPANTRKRFGNKVAEYVQYVDGIEDTEVGIREAVSLGVLPKSFLDKKIEEIEKAAAAKVVAEGGKAGAQ